MNITRNLKNLSEHLEYTNEVDNIDRETIQKAIVKLKKQDTLIELYRVNKEKRRDIKLKHELWFAQEYPNTYKDRTNGMCDAEIIFSHSQCAWNAAIESVINYQNGIIY